MRELPPALAAMGAYRQFILYLAQPSSSRPGKTDKFPCNFRDGSVVSAHDPSFWTDAATAIAAAEKWGGGYGVGFVFTEHDPFWFFDLDDCLLPDGSNWNPNALAFCNFFAGAAVEISLSGRGLHIFGSGKPPPHTSKNTQLHLEFYHTGRFVALTGIGAVGDCRVDFSQHLAGFVEQYFSPTGISGPEGHWSAEPVPEWRGSVDDDDLIRRACNSRSAAAAFGNKASFSDLWTNNLVALAACYPAEGRVYDASSADAALAQHLAFWTGKDCERIRRIMLKSGLYRDKWEREDYLPRTIRNAVARQTDVLTDRVPEPVTGLAEGEPPSATRAAYPTVKPTQGASHVSLQEQEVFFDGCVYISALHKVLVKGGIFLKPDQFRTMYGGFTFVIDGANGKTSKDAWEAFTQNQATRAPKAHNVTFRPELPPFSMIVTEGLTYTNSYWPIEVPRKVGSVDPFMLHLNKILPNERDRIILLSYMCACVQHKGIKFQWAPLLQGVEGNGKTLFSRCIVKAIGERYAHFPPAQELAEKFNSWLFNAIFIGVEDIYVPNQKQEVFEILKPMITSNFLAKRAMQTEQVMMNVCANFMFNTNHRDGLRKTKNDRRICTFFTAQQSAEDLMRDGMTGNYFPELYKWLDDGGYEAVTDLLYTWPIPAEFNPATNCQRAPNTSTTHEAIKAGVGMIEQEIQEAIDQELPGFCKGWISTVMFDRLIEHLGLNRKLSYAKRSEILTGMGYIRHPALTDGRATTKVLPDNAKPRLYIQKGSEWEGLMDIHAVLKAYETANNFLHRAPFLAAG